MAKPKKKHKDYYDFVEVFHYLEKEHNKVGDFWNSLVDCGFINGNNTLNTWVCWYT